MRKLYEYKYVIISYLITMSFLLLMFFMSFIIPFGDKSTTMYDSMHQYVPFLSVLYDKLTTGSSFQYAMSGGLGQDFYYIAAYYLMSPWNLIILLFGKSNIMLSINIITIIKMSLCGFTFAYYLQKYFKKRTILIIPFSLCYTFSSYMLAYFYNIMWLDILYILPILILCYRKMLDREKNGWIKYVIFLVLCILSNVYLSIPVCLFLMLLFLTEDFTKKNIFTKILRFGTFSLWAGLISCVIIIPTAIHLLSLGKSDMGLLNNVEILENFFTFISRGLTFTSTQVDMSFTSGGNYYCGTIILLTVLVYIFNTSYSVAHRIKKMLLLVLLYISMNISVLNFIWHGFAKPTGYVNRFSFIFIFMAISMSYSTLINIKNIEKYKVVLSMIVMNILIVELVIYHIRMQTIFDYLPMIIATAIFMIILDIIIFLYIYGKLNKRIFYNILCSVMIIETAIYSADEFRNFGFITIENTYLNENDYNYLVNKTKEKDTGYYRSDAVNCEFGNEPMYYGMNGVEVFSSTADKEILNAVGRLGFRSGSNFMSIKGLTPLTSVLLNIKYIYGNNAMDNYINYIETDFSGKVSEYENKYETSYAYLVENTIQNYNSDDYCKLVNQNKIVSAMTNNKVPYIYEFISPEKITIENGINECGGTFKKQDKASSPNTLGLSYTKNEGSIYELNLNYECNDDSILAIQADPSNSYAFNIKVNGSIYVTDYKIANEIIFVEGLKKGDIVTCNSKISEDATSGQLYITMAKYNEENFNQFYNLITYNPVTINDFKDGYVSLTTTTISEKTVFTSIPYTKGWKAYCNGKEIEIINLHGFLGILAHPGTQNIELKYSTPYLNMGIIISIISIILLIILQLFLVTHKRKENKYENIS